MSETADAIAILTFIRPPRERTAPPVRILHYPCTDGSLLATLKTALRRSVTYGAGPAIHRNALSRVDVVCQARLHEMRISPLAFSLAIIDLDRIPDPELVPTVVKACRALLIGGLGLFLHRGSIPEDALRVIASIHYPDGQPHGACTVRLPSGAVALAVRKGRSHVSTSACTGAIREVLDAPQCDPDNAPTLRLPDGGKSPTFEPGWITPEACDAIAREHGPWASGIPEEYLDEDPTRDNTFQPLMPLRRGHLALLVTSGAIGVVPVTVGGHRALLSGTTIRSHTEEKSGDTTVRTDSITPSITLLFVDQASFVCLQEQPTPRSGAEGSGR